MAIYASQAASAAADAANPGYGTDTWYAQHFSDFILNALPTWLGGQVLTDHQRAALATDEATALRRASGGVMSAADAWKTATRDVTATVPTSGFSFPSLGNPFADAESAIVTVLLLAAGVMVLFAAYSMVTR